MPIESSSTPAWDPSSRTPLAVGVSLWHSPAWNRANVSNEPSCSSQAIRQPSTHTSDPRHYLLNPSLANAQLIAIVNGGGHKTKELTVLFELIEGFISLRYIKYKKKHILEPDWVTPKQPSATQNNGLLMVIKGEHCGKYVRRITHDNTSTGPIIRLAVVVPHEEKADELTGEELRLSTEFLGLPVESKESKRLNMNLMNNLRAPFLKQRH